MRHLILLICCGSPIFLAAQPTKPAIAERFFDPALKKYHQAPMIALPEISPNKPSPAPGVPDLGVLRLHIDDWTVKTVAPDNMPCLVPNLNGVARMPNSIDGQMVLPFIPNAIPVKPKAEK